MSSGLQEMVPQFVVTASGIENAYYELGTGDPVIFLHGSGVGVSSPANWWLNLPVLARSHRTLALDLVGFGDTVDPPGCDYGIATWLEQILEFMDAVGVERASFVGNSLGGWLGLLLAARYPERVNKLVPMGPGGRFADAPQAPPAPLRPERRSPGPRGTGGTRGTADRAQGIPRRS